MKSEKHKKVQIRFVNNDHALEIFGPNGAHLEYLKENIPVTIRNRGNEVTLEGSEDEVSIAEKCLHYLRGLIENGNKIGREDLIDCLRAISQSSNTNSVEKAFQKEIVVSKKRTVWTRTIGQKRYVEAIDSHDIVFGIGPAGTGKTYLAMAMAMKVLLLGEVDRIILTRPAVEAGERLGFLPGDLTEKVDPYLRPLYDAIHDLIDMEKAQRLIASGQIEIAPLAFMRGRTLNHCHVILDEAQNCTHEQMKMFLTRLGNNSKAIITGDVTQVDLPRHTTSGLVEAVKILEGIKGIAIHLFNDKDVVRHQLVAEIIRAYEKATRIP